MFEESSNNWSSAVTWNSHGRNACLCHHLGKLLWFETLQCSL